MSAYTNLRAQQKARDHIKSAGAMKLHRIVDLDADDFCAKEGCYLAPHPMDENQGRGPAPAKPPKAERTEVAKFWRFAAVFALSFFATFLLLHWGVSK